MDLFLDSKIRQICSYSCSWGKLRSTTPQTGSGEKIWITLTSWFLLEFQSKLFVDKVWWLLTSLQMQLGAFLCLLNKSSPTLLCRTCLVQRLSWVVSYAQHVWDSKSFSLHLLKWWILRHVLDHGPVEETSLFSLSVSWQTASNLLQEITGANSSIYLSNVSCATGCHTNSKKAKHIHPYAYRHGIKSCFFFPLRTCLV